MGVLGQTLIQVIDSTVLYNIKIKGKCITVLHESASLFYIIQTFCQCIYSQVTFT